MHPDRGQDSHVKDEACSRPAYQPTGAYFEYEFRNSRLTRGWKTTYGGLLEDTQA